MPSTPEHKFLELVQGNRPGILKVCRVYSWNAVDQDDLYQEILFQIWRSLPTLKEAKFANTWVYRVAINTAISFVRKREVRTDRVVYVAPSDLTHTIESKQAAEENRDERLANLYSAIFRLDPLEKALITLFLEDLTYEQMAEVTGMNANNVGVTLHRVKKKLSALMKKEGQNE